MLSRRNLWMLPAAIAAAAIFVTVGAILANGVPKIFSDETALALPRQAEIGADIGVDGAAGEQRRVAVMEPGPVVRAPAPPGVAAPVIVAVPPPVVSAPATAPAVSALPTVQELRQPVLPPRFSRRGSNPAGRLAGTRTQVRPSSP